MLWPSKAKGIQERKGPIEGMRFTAIIKLDLDLPYEVLLLLSKSTCTISCFQTSGHRFSNPAVWKKGGPPLMKKCHFLKSFQTNTIFELHSDTELQSAESRFLPKFGTKNRDDSHAYGFN
jgi:hypothetical protein